MILPIHVYGDPILRQETQDIEADSPDLRQLIEDMLDTLANAQGVGLAAPQVGRIERVFVADLRSVIPHTDPDEAAALADQPMVCINPEIVWESEDVSDFEEGCLSIPNLYEIVQRPTQVTMHYLDPSFAPHEITVSGPVSSVLQHEYDHLEGILHIDYLTDFRRRLLKRRLTKIAKGDVEADYPLNLPPH